MFFVLGVIMIVSALAVIIVAFYIRLRILGDMDEEANYPEVSTAVYSTSTFHSGPLSQPIYLREKRAKTGLL
jgi:hypothetical protein